MATYSKSTQNTVKKEMHRFKKGTAKSGKDGKGGAVKTRKQAIAIALSEARKKGKKVPTKAKSATTSTKRSSTSSRKKRA